MSSRMQTRVGNKIVDAQPEPQPERPDFLEEGALVMPTIPLEPEQWDKSKAGWLTTARNMTPPILAGQAGVYLGEERVSVTDRKGNTTRKVVHTFFIGGGKYYAEPGWFTDYKPTKK